MKDIRVFSYDAYVDNDTFSTGLNNNDVIIGPSGSGKTGSYTYNQIKNATGSLIISDSKGLLLNITEEELKKKGYNILKLDIKNPEKSCGYNPLGNIRKNLDGSYREQDILLLADLLCQKKQHREPIWDLCTKEYIAFLIAYNLDAEDVDKHNLIRIAELHRIFSCDNGDLQFLEWIDENPDSFAAKKYFNLMANKEADKMWASIMGFVNVALAPFDFREAKYIFGRNSEENIDIKSLGERKTVLFVNSSDVDSSFEQISIILYTQALQLLCNMADSNSDGRLKIPVRFIMDDFGSTACIPDFDKIISVIRSREISVSIIIQSISQLESMYTPAVSKTIINNCDHIFFMGCNDVETAQFIGARVGKTPETILSISRKMAYFITAGQKARLVKKIKPYSFDPQKITLLPECD